MKQKGSRATMLTRQRTRSVHGQEAGNMQASKHSGKAGPLPTKEPSLCFEWRRPFSFLGTGKALEQEHHILIAFGGHSFWHDH